MIYYFPKKQDCTALIQAHSPFLSAFLDHSPASIENLMIPPDHKLETNEFMSKLRQQKQQAAYTIALKDMTGEWTDAEVMRHMSAFADVCTRACLSHLLHHAHETGIIQLTDPKVPEKNCGVTIIALGKWGAHELNYSSDIDLMIIFDPKKSPVIDRDRTQRFFTRLAHDFTRLMEHRSKDGYVFRTDLRLRPDPGATPPAVSIDAAVHYYQTRGQNWERAAMIKARPLAGDTRVSKKLVKALENWIWRRNLDFAAIQDIHSIKRQINTKQKRLENSFLNFNVKLGHGGIREIEFFAQTQQLIYGGREPSLRVKETISALAALTKTGHIQTNTCDKLTAAYYFLRRVEHRLQMCEDQQTHSLPQDEEGFSAIADFLGYKNTHDFIHDLQHHTDHVRNAYAGLFTESPNLTKVNGNLVFTGVDDDPETLVTLQRMHFKEPQRITSAVRAWHHGRYRATRSERARQLLTELIPTLLTTLSRTPHPDDAFTRFDRFLERLPAGVQIFSMFTHHLEIMQLTCDIMGTAPVMADYLSKHPQVLDGVFSQNFFDALPKLPRLKKELTRLLETAQDYQDILDITRRFVNERRFHAGIHILKNLSPDDVTSRYLADIADAALSCLIPHVETEFAKTHGTIKNGHYILLAMGSFGAQRMFTDSDLDLVALYKTPKNVETSDGKKSLPVNLYYIRLTQRLITALSSPTGEGIVYETDFRLRPDGNKGPLAVSMEGFLKYQQENAWTFEHMSLIRARVIYAKPSVRRKLQKDLLNILSCKRNTKKLKKDILDMRKKIAKEFGTKDPWDLKNTRGGLTDIMFLTQFLSLKHGHKYPDIFTQATLTCLENLKIRKLLSAKDYKTLCTTYRTIMAATGILRLTIKTFFDPGQATEGLKQIFITRIKDQEESTFRRMTTDIKKQCAESFAVYQKILK